MSEKNLSYIGDKEINYDSNGQMSYVGDEKVYYSSDGRISYIGDTKVYYDSSGKISIIGNERVYRSYDGSISYVGNEKTYNSVHGNSVSSDNTSSSGSSSGVEIFLFIAILVSSFIGIAILATPIIAPILLLVIDSAQKRGDWAEFKWWKGWATLTSILSILVVGCIAGVIGVIAFLWTYAKLSHLYPSSIVPTPIFVFLILMTVTIFMLSFITGIAPTAIVFLRYKETQLCKSGKTTQATTLNRLNWAIGLVAAGTVVMVIIGIAILIILAIFSK